MAGPTQGRATTWFLLGALLAFLAAAVFRFGPSGARETILIGSLLAQGLFACLAFAARDVLGPTRLPGGLGLGPGRLGGARVAALALGCVGLSHAASLVLAFTGLDQEGTLAEIAKVVEGSRGASFWLVVLTLGIAPAFAEELLFRGALQRWLATRIAQPLAIAGAAGAFAIVHGDPVHSPAALLLGLYLGAAAARAGSTRAAIAGHLANNLMGLALPALLAVFPRAALGVSATLLLGGLVGAVWGFSGAAPGPPAEGQEPFSGDSDLPRRGSGSEEAAGESGGAECLGPDARRR